MIVDDAVCWTGFSSRSLAKTLVDGWHMLRGTPQAELSIRRNGSHWVSITTNHWGEVANCEISPPHTSTVTEINPTWHVFTDGMANVLA